MDSQASQGHSSGFLAMQNQELCLTARRAAALVPCQSRQDGLQACLDSKTRLPGGVELEAMLTSWVELQICFPTLAIECT